MKAQMYNYSSWIKETNPDILFDKYMNDLNEAGFKQTYIELSSCVKKPFDKFIKLK